MGPTSRAEDIARLSCSELSLSVTARTPPLTARLSRLRLPNGLSACPAPRASNALLLIEERSALAGCSHARVCQSATTRGHAGSQTNQSAHLRRDMPSNETYTLQPCTAG